MRVLVSRDPANAIVQAAERLGVELVCLGTHGESQLSKLLLGSAAEAVLRRSRRPVLLVRAPLE